MDLYFKELPWRPLLQFAGPCTAHSQNSHAGILHSRLSVAPINCQFLPRSPGGRFLLKPLSFLGATT